MTPLKITVCLLLLLFSFSALQNPAAAACDPPCLNGTCNVEDMCDCDEGWIGGSCNNCIFGYYGPTCQPCPACENGSSCYDGLSGDGHCICQFGWQGPLCADDVNECTGYVDDCDDNATCTNNVGGFTCACNEGYEGDGKDCSKINECLEEVDWTACDEGACFNENCEALGEGDRCENAADIILGNVAHREAGLFHTYMEVPAACAGEILSGTDAFFSLGVNPGKNYRLTLSMDAELDMALVAWTSCDGDAVACLGALNDFGLGSNESMVYEADAGGSIILQALVVQITELRADQTPGFALLVEEIQDIDGDEETDGDEEGDGDDDLADGDEIIDGDVVLDGDVVADGDEDGDLTVDGDDISDGDEAVDGDDPVDGDIVVDGDEGGGNNWIDGDISADGDTSKGSGGGGCRNTESGPLVSLMLGLMLLYRRWRKREVRSPV